MEAGMFYFDFCAIVFLIIIFISLFVRGLSTGRSNKVFIVLLACVLISAIFDMWALIYGTYIPITSANVNVRMVVNIIYFLTRNLSAPLYILYNFSYMGVWHIYVRNHTKFALWTMPFVLEAILIISNPITNFVFYFDENMKYTRGFGMPVMYAVAGFYLCFGLYILIKYRNLMSKDKFLALFSQYPISIVTIAVQMIIPNLMVEIFGISVVMLLIYTMVHRGEEIVDPVIGVKNYNAALIEIKHAFEFGRDFRIIYLKISNCATIRTYIGVDSFNEMLHLVGDTITHVCNVHKLNADVYYMLNGSYMVMTESNDMEVINNVAFSICNMLGKPTVINDLNVEINCRSCIVRCPEDIDGYIGVMNFDNVLMKSFANTNKVVTLSEVADSKDFKLKNELDDVISSAIKNHKFKMYYQPIYSAEKMKFVSAEALIRLIDDKYGFVPPSLFIPAAEESGAIHQIGDYVLEEVCSFIERIDMDALGLEHLEINLSLAQCIETDFVQKVRNILNNHNVDVSKIRMEITETAADIDPTAVDRNVFALSKAGIKFLLDDYGVGYSNIKRVIKLPFEVVKLDKSFVDEMNDPNMWIVIKNTVNMLHEMKKIVLVEGVEEKATLDRFLDIGCEYIQGFYFSKPLPEDEFVEFVKSGNF